MQLNLGWQLGYPNGMKSKVMAQKGCSGEKSGEQRPYGSKHRILVGGATVWRRCSGLEGVP
ncbi:hypothetical protein GCM10011383_45090 [Hymenobacter cavernae]|uniref:Uncharacterized protein n=1 Tax=Hymenobacter cavernae TaxID=2044852 RepID=A0ABQ1UW88_9BACT|nr:hypothetical protein GCM10011383_45090 [Hymenobacter cavernae]